MNTMHTHTTKPLGMKMSMEKILLGKNPSIGATVLFMIALICVITLKTLDAFFVFRLPEMGTLRFIALTTASTLLAFAVFFLIVYQGLKLSKTIANPKKVARQMAGIFAFIILLADLSKITYLSIPDNAIVRLLLLITFYLFVGIYLLAALVMDKNNFRQPEI